MEPLRAAYGQHRHSAGGPRRAERARTWQEAARHSIRRGLLEPSTARPAHRAAGRLRGSGDHPTAQGGRLREVRRPDAGPDPRDRPRLGGLQGRQPKRGDPRADLPTSGPLHRPRDAARIGPRHRVRSRSHPSRGRRGVDRGADHAREQAAARRRDAQHPPRRRPRPRGNALEFALTAGRLTACGGGSTCGCAHPEAPRTRDTRTSRPRPDTCGARPG